MLVENKTGHLLRITPSNIMRVDTRKTLANVQTMHPKAILLSETGRNLSFDDARQRIDLGESIYFIIRLLVFKYYPTRTERFKAFIGRLFKGGK